MLTELQFYCLKFVKLKDVLSSFLILGLLLCRHFSFPTWKQCSKFGELGRLLVFADHGHRSLHQVFALKHRHVPMSLKTKSHHYTKGLPNNALPGFTALFSRCLKTTKKSHFALRAKRATFISWVNKKFIKNAKVVENIEIQKLKCYILSNFQTMCFCLFVHKRA